MKIFFLMAITIFSFSAIQADTKNMRASKVIRTGSVDKSLSDMLRDAELSHSRNDLLRSIKLFDYVRKKNRQMFLDSNSLFTYYKLLNELYGSKVLFEACNKDIKLSSNKIRKEEINFQCARGLFVSEHYSLANKILLRVKLKAWKTKILLASSYLALNSPEKCIHSLDGNYKSEKVDLTDLIHLTRARCFSAMARYHDADSSYKRVTSRSLYYIDSLYELAWVQFKLRNIGDSKSTIDVLLASYDDENREYGQLSKADYISLRFLRSYLGLVQMGASDVKVEAEQLQRDVNANQRKAQSQKQWQQNLNSFRTQFQSRNSDSLLANPLLDFMKILSDWGLTKEVRAFDKDWRFYISILFEERNIKIYSSRDYETKIRKLIPILEKSLVISASMLEKKLDAIRNSYDLRIQLAIRKNNLLTQTQGIRSLEEAKQVYKSRESYLEGLLGDIQ